MICLMATVENYSFKSFSKWTPVSGSGAKIKSEGGAKIKLDIPFFSSLPPTSNKRQPRSFF